MRRAIRVAVHFLQLSDAVVLESVGESRAYSGMVLVVAGSFQLDRLSVQEESLLRVEFHRANAEGRLATVDYIAASAYLGHQPVEVSLLKGPEEGPADNHLLAVGLFSSRGD